MEIFQKLEDIRPKLKVVLFDFDGTISTLRQGWEGIMEPLMLEMISGGYPIDEDLEKEVKGYIDQSTGIQTIYQMEWLAAAVKKYGRNRNISEDPWWYKKEYNKRLMVPVHRRIESLHNGEKQPEDYLIKGCVKFLKALREKGLEIFVASGTDDPDLKNEAEILGVKQYFKETAGAPVGRADCSKEAVLRRFVNENKLKGLEVVVVGDGKVEIALGREVGAITIGVASDEEKRSGVNPVKRDRLIKAGAHAIIGDFESCGEIIGWLFNISSVKLKPV